MIGLLFLLAPFLVKAALALLAYLVGYVILERTFFFLRTGEAAPAALAWLFRQWKSRTSEPVPPGSLGWLGPLMRTAGRDTSYLITLCDEKRRQIERYRGYLPTAAGLATSLGLLGSVLALSQSADTGKADPVVIIGLGMGTTIVGLFIALPATVAACVLARKEYRLAEQAEAVLQQLMAPGIPAGEKQTRARRSPRYPRRASHEA